MFSGVCTCARLRCVCRTLDIGEQKRHHPEGAAAQIRGHPRSMAQATRSTSNIGGSGPVAGYTWFETDFASRDVVYFGTGWSSTPGGRRPSGSSAR